MTQGKPQDALCCCEYINQDGERSHILACLCECDAIDEIADRCFTCKPLPGSLTDRLYSTVQDRTRIPWFSGRGALKVRLDIVLPAIVIPSFIYAGTFHPFLTFLAVISCPAFLLCFYRCWTRSASNFRRTKLFFSWAIVSLLFCFFMPLLCLIILRKVLLWEIMTISTLFLLLLYSLLLIKTKSSVVRRMTPAIHRHRKSRSFSGMEYDGAMVATVPGMRQDEKPLPYIEGFSWCKICEREQPPRSGHCSVCNVCVLGRDHHCVWVDECIGAGNHRAFFIGLTLFLITGVYGIHLALTSVCTPEMYFNWFLLPADCRFVYSDPVFAWLFSAAMYALSWLLVMFLLWCYQFILISRNLTSYELHKAQTQKKSSIFLPFHSSRYNHGFFRNWTDFLSGRRAKLSSKTEKAATV